MDISHIFDPLNEAQREAVAAPEGAMLVLAGAGSGKTRVLVHRIAWLVQGLEVSPLSILSVTFTNKAAREMRGRIEELLQIPFGGLWMGTFHGICHRLLRMHYAEAGLPQSFEILDSSDQHRLIKRALKELELDEAYWNPRQMQWMINQHKEEGRRAHQLTPTDKDGQHTLYRIYAHYEALCKRFGLVDFAEILLRSLELLRNNQTLREHYQQRFRHILVDEFQDTNGIQYQWIKLLSARHQNLFAVGDDDQSIYGWRGARVENILKFEADFKNATVFRLEQNYRSTSNILNAANAVIEHNTGRLGKDLWTDSGEGALIRSYAAINEIDEAQFVVGQIRAWQDQGNRLDACAILYRSNAQSRVFESELLKQDIPYRVYGGLRFFERAEIKDALAYLRLITNINSDPAFARIVNHPPRGIGNKTLECVGEIARARQLSMWQACTAIIAEHGLPSRALSAVSFFQDLISGLINDTREFALAEITDYVVRKSGLIEHYGKERGEKAQGRVENLEELVNAARNFSVAKDDFNAADDDELSLFLSAVALEAGEGQAADAEDCVQIMSLHSAKGLEFPLVFLCGLEEGLFPHTRSIEEERLEEERRLCYVGMTRAMVQLYVCYAEVRRVYGRENYNRPSRFLSEIPEQYVEEIRNSNMRRPLAAPVSTALADHKKSIHPSHSNNELTFGAQVRHTKFGEGMVVNLEGQGSHARVQVNFVDHGAKWLICAYANLELA